VVAVVGEEIVNVVVGHPVDLAEKSAQGTELRAVKQHAKARRPFSVAPAPRSVMKTAFHQWG